MMKSHLKWCPSLDKCPKWNWKTEHRLYVGKNRMKWMDMSITLRKLIKVDMWVTHSIDRLQQTSTKNCLYWEIILINLQARCFCCCYKLDSSHSLLHPSLSTFIAHSSLCVFTPSSSTHFIWKASFIFTSPCLF